MYTALHPVTLKDVCRLRRSAESFEVSRVHSSLFFGILCRALGTSASPEVLGIPYDVMQASQREISLGLVVIRVEGLPSGLYSLALSPLGGEKESLPFHDDRFTYTAFIKVRDPRECMCTCALVVFSCWNLCLPQGAAYPQEGI